MKRWVAKISYHTEAGPKVVVREIEELSELHDIVETGPNWDAIEGIEITKGRPGPLGLISLERSQSLRGYHLMNLD